MAPSHNFPLWVDAQLPPALARWLRDLGESQAAHVAELGLLEAEDPEIFAAARQAGAVVLTKDSDFVQLLELRGAPPRVVWVTCGNCANPVLKELFGRHWSRAKELLEAGELVVEIGHSRLSSD